MLGEKRFVKKSVVSSSEQNASDALDVLADSGGDLTEASSKLGLTKSSLKRRISSSYPQSYSYDELSPLGASRRYLEKNFGKWKVLGLNKDTGSACVEMKNPNSTIRISVNVNLNALGKFTLGT